MGRCIGGNDMKKKGLFYIVVILVCGGFFFIADHSPKSMLHLYDKDEGFFLRIRSEKATEHIKEQLEEDHAYLNQLHEEFQYLHTQFEAHDFLNENLQLDGPLFADTFLYLDTCATSYDELREEALRYVDKDSVRKRAKELSENRQYQKIYIAYIHKNFSYVPEAFQSPLPQQIAYLRKIFQFLKDNRKDWTAYDRGILFDREDVRIRYEEMLHALINGGMKDGEDI